ncbi:MAG: hypothetical protein ACQEP7_06465 [bacterium]
MTFKESDFPSLLHRIKQVIEATENPAVAVELIREIVEAYEDIPLYPGIVEMISYNMINETPANELSEGDLVEFADSDRAITGQVKAIENGTITLEKVLETGKSATTQVEKNEFKSCQKINQETLKEEWPELYFGEDSQ